MDTGIFFETLNRRLERIMQDESCFRIKIGEYIIEIRLPSEKDLKEMKAYLAGKIFPDNGKVDAVFYFWTDNPVHYFGSEDTSKMWIHEDKKGYMQLVPDGYFMGVDWKNNSFYYCRHISKAEILPYRIIPLVQLWSGRRGMQVLHGAVVGVNGRGVLLAAHGGGGKSTLSVSCLLAGMDFVADDYFLVNTHGPLYAMPIETIVKLHADMMEQLTPAMPIVWTDISRNNKKIMDASGYEFSKALSVEAIICPKIENCDEPQITALEPMKVLMALIHSTLIQKMTADYTKEAHAIFTRFFGLPTYELRLSRDLEKNVKILRTFIEGSL